MCVSLTPLRSWRAHSALHWLLPGLKRLIRSLRKAMTFHGPRRDRCTLRSERGRNRVDRPDESDQNPTLHVPRTTRRSRRPLHARSGVPEGVMYQRSSSCTRTCTRMVSGHKDHQDRKHWIPKTPENFSRTNSNEFPTYDPGMRSG